MAAFDDPELEPIEGSEIAACIDTSAMGTDGIPRPIFIDQLNEETLALTLDDAERLYGFLGDAIQFLKEFRTRITQ